MEEVGETGESVASRVALQSEIRLSRDASLKPCEARRDEMRLDAAGMRRQKRGEQNEEATRVEGERVGSECSGGGGAVGGGGGSRALK